MENMTDFHIHYKIYRYINVMTNNLENIWGLGSFEDFPFN